MNCVINLENIDQRSIFFEKWNISKDCIIKANCKSKICSNIQHLYVSKIILEKLENYLHTLENGCKIWLGKFRSRRPFYSDTDLRNYVYNQDIKGYSINISCGDNRCLNIDHMYLTKKINNIYTSKVKLNLDKAKEIRSLWAEGYSPSQIALEYDISKQAVSLILNNRSWFDKNYIPKSKDYSWEKT